MVVAASKWLKGALQEERIHDFLAKLHIKWQFSPSHSRWWGGQFERIIRLTKQSLFKAIWKTKVTWKELESVLFILRSHLVSDSVDILKMIFTYLKLNMI